MIEEDLSKYNNPNTILRKAQLRMLDILIEVDKICRKYNIPYWLDSGTLLGAIRHGGFIPWDDDLDIAIMRKDYKRMRKHLIDELPEYFALQDKHTDKKYFLNFGKVRDRRTVFYDSDDSQVFKERGIYIDILMLEEYKSIKIKRIVDFFWGRAFRRIKGVCIKKRYEVVLAYLLYPFACFLVCLGRLLAIFEEEKCGFAYGIPFYCELNKKDIFPCKELIFEGHVFFAPNDYDAYLRREYGDYMQMPPENERKTHALKIEFLD